MKPSAAGTTNSIEIISKPSSQTNAQVLYQKKQNFKWPSTFNRRFSSINDFAMGEILGKGGFSQVYKATHKSTGTVYAIKKVLSHDGRWI